MGSTGRINSASGGGIAPVSGTPISPNVIVPPVNQDNPDVAEQAPSDQNTPVTPSALDRISQMSDDELAATVIASQSAVMPNYLADGNDATQKFVYQAGLNEKPLVLDSADFAQYMKDNNISNGEILARSVNSVRYKNQQGYTTSLTAQQVQDILKYSRLTYIGGKHGGQAYGAGAYFAMTGGDSTGYGGNTALAVLNPSKAKIISDSELYRKSAAFAQSHPKFARAVGNITSRNISIWALAMGYNVITDHRPDAKGNYAVGSRGDYYNIIDRSAIVYEK